MASKPKFFSWSKGSRTPSSEPYHRTGGLLAIDTSVADAGKEACLASDFPNARRPGRRRPPMLNLSIPSASQQHLNCLSPASARHNALLVNSASNLLAVVNDMLRSPGLSATVCRRSAEIHKPLPSRPRSVSLPSTPAEPPAVELPGSILLENQGFPVAPVEPTVEPLSIRASTMRSARSGNSLSSSATALARPSPSKLPQHKKSLSEAGLQRRSKSKPNLLTSPSSTSTDSKITTTSLSANGGHASSAESSRTRVGVEKSLQPSPLIVEAKSVKKNSAAERSNQRDELGTPNTPTPTPIAGRSKRIDELNSVITAQDNTISTLQTQFGSLRASHEAHVASLVDAHQAEVASLKNYTRVLEEQQSQRTLHHASSNHLLLFLDPTEPQTPTRESPQTTAGSTSATSIRSFKTAFEQPVRTPHPARESPDMESFKRKLSATRRPDANRDAIRELNQYKTNNAALQKQIESLMAKLNQSKKNERTLSETLEEIERNCSEWQGKASRTEKLEKSTLALQNTIDHLEYRLEMANAEKLDAEEQIFNMQYGRSPFDPTPTRLQIPEPQGVENNHRNTHMSMSTIFSTGSPNVSNEPQESTTLGAFISHIERLQEEVRQKDSRIAQLEHDGERQRHVYGQLERDHKELNLQSEIQEQLMKKTRDADAHIQQLQSAITDRESTIGEKEKALKMAERQLEHHKLLLHAEVRRHATMSLFADTGKEPLPDLAQLASKEDIDRWVSRLQARLKKEQNKDSTERRPDDLTTLIQDLRSEIDFYVREIIYYKLDIKGYKSDIKKLKGMAARMGNFSRASDVESPTPSQCQSATTPSRQRFPSVTPGLGISSTPSPISAGHRPASSSANRPVTPSANAAFTPDPSPADTIKPIFGSHKRPQGQSPMTPQTPPFRMMNNPANETDNMDPGVSPRSVPRLSPERRKPTPPSPDQEKFGDMATNFPINTPAAPKRHDTQRSMSDSIIQLYTAPRTPDWSPASNPARVATDEKPAIPTRQRSGSVPNLNKSTPERPPRPRYGLFENNTQQDRINVPPTPPRIDVMAEAMRNSPDHTVATDQTKAKDKDEPTPLFGRKFPDLSSPGRRDLSNTQLSRPGSKGSTSAVPTSLPLRSRAGSTASSTNQPSSPPPQRKLSAASGSSIPFIIGMPSPHNPALISPTTTMPPTTCSITGKSTNSAPAKGGPSIRTGVGGTMASTTPVTSPTETSHGGLSSYFSSSNNSNKPTSPKSTTHSRNTSSSFSMSLPSRKESPGHSRNTSFSMSLPSRKESPGHSRNVSGSSIRSAMQLPGSLMNSGLMNSGLMKGKGKTRKESIGHPTPLASPFDIDRTNSAGGVGVVGQAI